MSGAKQPEALRLAEQLENLPYQIYDLPEPKLAAATLRTQHALLEQAREALMGIDTIVRNSQGVAGYHLNGDTAEWDDFDQVDAADQTLAALNQHLDQP